ncbi:thioesterase domain-containing protein [Nocardia transvalensis]|uniref:thioesterase domain-containing protein n=1 Tax=Nocardia transvalensis TaxID=37333 RepID=UPI0018943E72|nr:thioesterase domain-containing protein [Nocardia transvalensis]MBF6329414.1 hypothetical protein [Nocardia transvalensis]
MAPPAQLVHRRLPRRREPAAVHGETRLRHGGPGHRRRPHPAGGGSETRCRPAPTLDALARHYLDTIRRIQPHGPYHLLGYSLGGNIVHALAAALEESGETAAYVGLVDSHPLTELTAQAVRSLRDPARLDGLLPELPGDAPELAAAIRSAATDLLGMVTRSATPRYTGPMALYVADTGTEPDHTRTQLAGWRAADAHVIVRRLPYSHFDIVSPTGWTEIAALLDVDPAIGA